MSAPIAPLRLVPGPGAAHDWLQRELAKGEYRPSLIERLNAWFEDLLNSASPGSLAALGRPVLLVLLVVLVLVLALVMSRLRRNPAEPVVDGAVFAEVRRSSQEHRRLARAAYDDGDWDSAVVEGMRALAAGLVERRVVDDVPAATAHEVTELARPRFPDLPLADAATVFDETRYGGRRATREKADRVLAVERVVAATDPHRRAAGPVAAVPR